MTSVTAPDLADRADAYKGLKAELERRGPAALHPRERDLVMDTADALFFEEDDAADKLVTANDLLDQLAAGRWTPEAAEIVKTSLARIG
jgi:hypothetical protein